jgi:hypothetical protein
MKMLMFFFYKIGEQECRTGSAWGDVTSGRRRRWGKGVGG